jgi:hypothetical protein
MLSRGDVLLEGDQKSLTVQVVDNSFVPNGLTVRIVPLGIRSGASRQYIEIELY